MILSLHSPDASYISKHIYVYIYIHICQFVLFWVYVVFRDSSASVSVFPSGRFLFYVGVPRYGFVGVRAAFSLTMVP